MDTLTVGGTILRAVQGDIKRLATDAIVNAANAALLPGGGVCGAIHAAGGPSIAEECARIGGCATGDAVATGAGALPARFVIHAVGPVWRGGHEGEPELLASAYRRSLDVARDAGARRVAFPAISTGIYGFPLAPACEVALTSVAAAVAAHPGAFDEVTFVAFDKRTFETYLHAFGNFTKR